MSGKRYDALTVRETTDQKSGEVKTYWTKIGAAWENDKGMSIQLDALPINGKIILREPKQRGGGDPF